MPAFPIKTRKPALAIHHLPEFFARPETDGLTFFYGDGITGPGVTSSSRRLGPHGECSEMNKFDRSAFYHGFFHGLKEAVNH